jgi:hypothetical protein
MIAARTGLLFLLTAVWTSATSAPKWLMEPPDGAEWWD